MPAFYRTAYSTLGHAFQENVLGSADGLTLGPDVWRPASRYIRVHALIARAASASPVLRSLAEARHTKKLVPSLITSPTVAQTTGPLTWLKSVPMNAKMTYSHAMSEREKHPGAYLKENRSGFSVAAALPVHCCCLKMCAVTC